MEIAGVLTAGKFLSAALGQLGRRCQPQAATAGQPSENAATPVAATAAETAAFREIVASYDVKEISPRDFSEMIQKLHDTGLLTDQQFQELSQIRVELDLARVEPDEDIDLADFYLDKFRALHESPEGASDATGLLPARQRSQLASLGRGLQWVEKFAAIQSAEDGGGLDALA